MTKIQGQTAFLLPGNYSDGFYGLTINKLTQVTITNVDFFGTPIYTVFIDGIALIVDELNFQ